MTPLMLKALSAAEAADYCGGLRYTVAGWVTDRNFGEYHSPATVRALEARGALKALGKGRQRQFFMTAYGRELLSVERGLKS